MNITLLSAENIWGDEALEILKEDAMKTASLSDLAVLLGGRQFFDVCAADGEPSGWLWTSSADEYEDIRAVTKGSVMGFACTSWRDVSVRPMITASQACQIPQNKIKKGRAFKGIETILSGEFPQTLADNQDKLELLYQAKKLKQTGKSYQFDYADIDDYDAPYQAKSYTEYTLNGEKYIRVRPKLPDWNCSRLSSGEHPMNWQPYFIKVEPVEWLKDKSGALVAKKALVAGFRFDEKEAYNGRFEKTSMYRRLKQIGDKMEPMIEKLERNKKNQETLERILNYKESVIQDKVSEQIKKKYILDQKQKN